MTVTVEWGVTDNYANININVAPAFLNGTRCDTEEMDGNDYLGHWSEPG